MQQPKPCIYRENRVERHQWLRLDGHVIGFWQKESRNLTFILVDLASQKLVFDFRAQEIKVISHSTLQMLFNKSENVIPTSAPVGLWQVCGLTNIGVFVMGKPLSWFGSWGKFSLLRCKGADLMLSTVSNTRCGNLNRCHSLDRNHHRRAKHAAASVIPWQDVSQISLC